MLERNPNLTSEQVREIIAKTARKEPDYFFNPNKTELNIPLTGE